VESVAAFAWNGWQASSGISGNLGLEYARILNSIFISARQLATYYWQRQGRVPMKDDEFQKHLAEMQRHEGVFWDSLEEEDEIREKLKAVQDQLDSITRPCFDEPMKTYSIFTKQWFKKS